MMRVVIASVLGVALLGAGAFFIAKGSSPVAVGPSVTAKDIFGGGVANDTNAGESASAPPVSASSAPVATNNAKTSDKKIMNAIFHTNKGDITIEFFSTEAPNTVENFIKLAKSGFYDGVKFHRVIAGFMIQGGDPLTKDDSQQARWGTGGPGYTFADEIHTGNANNAGTIAMANAGPNTNGSQFFINVANNNFLDTKHTVFGRVTSGMDVVSAIEHTQTGPGDRPLTPVVINSITLQ